MAPKTPVAPIQSGNLGFCFSVTPFGLTEISPGAIAASKLRPQVNFGEIIDSRGQWIKCTASFVPDQPFQYFAVGNFFSDKLTPNNLAPEKHKKMEQLNALRPAPLDRIKRVNYLCVDDISLMLENPPPPPASLEKALLKDRKYTFSAGVLFDSGKADLDRKPGPNWTHWSLFCRNFRIPCLVSAVIPMM